MEEQKVDFSGNLAKRYRRLFRLPSKTTAVVSASAFVLILEISVCALFGTPPLDIVAYCALAEVILLFSIEIDRQYLKQQSAIATFRRLAAISMISYAFSMLILAFALLVFIATRDRTTFFDLMIIGVFFAISFRAFVTGSVFHGQPVHGLPISLVQPVLLSVPILVLPGLSMHFGVATIATIIAGCVYLVAIEAYLLAINGTMTVDGRRPLQLLQAFLSAWTLEDAVKMEDVFDEAGKSADVSSALLKINGSAQGASAEVIIPGIHPGPFYPVGSSNLPGDIFTSLCSPKNVPLIVHSISDHELNLPTKEEVRKYVSSLDGARQIESGVLMSHPVVKSKDRATVVGLEFGSVALIFLTLAPNGGEDFPVEVREKLEKVAKGKGLSLAIVVDSHNSEGAKPSAKDCDDAVGAATDVLDELARVNKKDFKVGFAHSIELNQSMPRDIGPAGIGLLVFKTEDPQFTMVIVDANNAKLGFREQVFQEFEKQKGAKILEMCTSDTHVTAAKVTGGKGYLALGDIISVEEFSSILGSLYDLAAKRVGQGSYSVSLATSHVKTIGGDALKEFSGLLDRTSGIAKRGALILIGLGVAVAVFAALI